MSPNMLVATVLLLVVSFTVFGEEFRTGTCGKTNSTKCESIYIDKETGKTSSSRHTDEVADFVMQGELPNYSPALKALRKAQAVSQAKSSIPLRDNGLSIGIGAARSEGEDGFAVGFGYAKERVKVIFSIGDGGSVSAGISYKF